MPAVRRRSDRLSVASRSVVKSPPRGNSGGWGDFILNVSQEADSFPGWSVSPHARDVELRRFWKSEPTLAGALYSTAAKYAAFGWRLTGLPRMVGITRRMLHSSDRGAGWGSFTVKLLQDVLGTDNAGFIEILRTEDAEDAPAVMVNHLDSNRCFRTGDLYEPVEYRDSNGQMHALKWYQVIPFSEFPSAEENAFGVQFCAVSRILKAAQIMRDISQYKKEKISGRNVRAIHLVGGVSAKNVRDAMLQHQVNTASEGFSMYVEPLVVASISPNATVSKATIEMASLPDGFDEEVAMRWYINQLALAFGSDYQDFAPLPGGNLGTAQQSQVLHLKARGKGPALFMSMIETYFNFRGIMPPTVTFRYGEQDQAADEQEQKLRNMRAMERSIRLKSLEIDAKTARQLANDAGDLPEEYLGMIGEENQLGTVTVSSTKDLDAVGPVTGHLQVRDGVVEEPAARVWTGFGDGGGRWRVERDKLGRVTVAVKEVPTIGGPVGVLRRVVERDSEGRFMGFTEETL